MNVKYFFLLKVIFSTITPIFSDNFEEEYIDNLFVRKSFADNLPSNVLPMAIAENLRETFFHLISLPRKNITDEVNQRRLVEAFGYIEDAFKYIETFENKDKHMSNEEILKPLKMQACQFSTVEFLESCDKIEKIWKNVFARYIKIYSEYKFEELGNLHLAVDVKKTFQKSLEALQGYAMLLQNKIAVTRNITENIFRSYFKCFLSANEDDNCNLTPLSNQLFRLYKRGLFAAMRAYTIKIVYLEFSHIILKKYDTFLNAEKYNYNEYSNLLHNLVMSLTGEIYLITPENTSYKNCDPPNWIEGENYIRIKNYVSQKLDHNLKISKFNQINRPESECSDYSILTDSNRNLFISKRCPEIFELNSYRIVDCANTGQQEMTNNNLANWTLECSNDNYGIDLNSHCSCDKMSDQDLSLRTVSLREEVTDSSDNWVVTGIRFAVKNNGLMIQIQEGQLINETIDLKTVKWQTDEERILEKGIESVRLNYYVKSFNLDDIQVPFREFVTGVKFMILNGRLTLAVRGTEMWDDFKSWPSINHKWHKPKFTSKEQRLKIDVQDFKNSAEIKSQTKELSSSQRNYIDLTVGLYSSNSSILPIIPFFDSQPVITNPPAPIGGVGLFYKSQLSYGGFIAFKYMSSKYTFNPQVEINCFIKNNS